MSDLLTYFTYLLTYIQKHGTHFHGHFPSSSESTSERWSNLQRISYRVLKKAEGPLYWRVLKKIDGINFFQNSPKKAFSLLMLYLDHIPLLMPDNTDKELKSTVQNTEFITFSEKTMHGVNNHIPGKLAMVQDTLTKISSLLSTHTSYIHLIYYKESL